MRQLAEGTQHVHPVWCLSTCPYHHANAIAATPLHQRPCRHRPQTLNTSTSADVAYATKGTVTKSIDYMSKKNFGILHHRRAHLHIKLREAPPEGYRGWKARLTVPFQLGAPRAKRRGFDRVGQV